MDNANYGGTGSKDKWGKCAPVGSSRPMDMDYTTWLVMCLNGV